ncbi:MAG: GNAT family N-acetyltransferase [Planctomycetota bacterium]|nr:GNAT family N-acetyltransferase [Planctomycetota bacterium]
MNVTLREVADDDLPVFFEHQRDPAYDHMAAFTRGDRDDRAGFMAHWAKIRADPTIVLRTILLDGQVVGSVGSFVMFGEREVTYGVGREHWGKGVATAALQQLLALLPERPLHARAAADNLGSLRVLAKCGFEVTGRDRGFAGARGQEVDEVVLRLSV